MRREDKNKPEEKTNFSELNINQKQATNYVAKSILIIVVALLFSFVTLFILFNFLYPTSSNTTQSNDICALNSSTTYYKNGGNFYTLSSSQNHYKCTNSSHSGSNDYTSSSVSGTCYSENTSYTTVRYSHSCSTTGITCYCSSAIVRAGATLWLCDYCGTCIKSNRNLDDAGSSYSSSSTCSARKYQCSYCNSYFSSNSTASCSSRGTYKRCDECGGNWSSCSCKYYYSHNLSYNYTQYTYKNIDTGSTTTSTNSYSVASGYTVSYNSNGGSGSMSSQYFLHGHSQALTANSFTRANYRFKGWATSTTGAVAYTDRQSLNRSSGSNMTLYANWELLSFTITLNNQGATTAGTTSVTASNGQPMPSITVPAKTGYTFGGYYTGTNGSGTQYYTASGTSARTCDLTGAITLYAKWTANTYTVVYNSNDGSGTMGNSTHVYDTSKTLSENAFTRTGYSFAGWATSSDGAVVYSDKQSVLNLSSTNGATVNLYAKWTANTYTVVYNSNGGTGTMDNSTHVYGTSNTLTKNMFIRTGFTFTGWATSGSGAKAYDDEQSVSTLATTNGATVNLYAVWRANIYKISFDSQNATVAGTTSTDATYGQALPSITVATRNNYILDGYYTEVCGKGTKYYDANGTALISTWTNTQPITLYANWLWCTIAGVTGTVTDYTVYTTADEGKKYASLMFIPASGEVVEFSFDNTNWFVVNKTQCDVKNSTVSVGLIYYTNDTSNRFVLEFKNITYDGTIRIYIRIS